MSGKISLFQNDERLCDVSDYWSKAIGVPSEEKLGLLEGTAAPGGERCKFKVPPGTSVRNGTEDRHSLEFVEAGETNKRGLKIGMIVDLTDVSGVLEA